MRYKVTWTMYFTDSNIPDTIAVAIVEAASVSKARYAAYKQMIPDRGYRFEWFINETEVEKIEMIQRWILLHSYLYYELDNSITSDANYNANAQQLIYLKNKYPEEFKETRYYQYFYDFESSTGFDLIARIKDKNDKILMNALKLDANILMNLKDKENESL